MRRAVSGHCLEKRPVPRLYVACPVDVMGAGAEQTIRSNALLFVDYQTISLPSLNPKRPQKARNLEDEGFVALGRTARLLASASASELGDVPCSQLRV